MSHPSPLTHCTSSQTTKTMARDNGMEEEKGKEWEGKGNERERSENKWGRGEISNTSHWISIYTHIRLWHYGMT